jgi:hypothetical protein
MPEHNTNYLYLLLTEAERLEFRSLGEYYNAKTRERHHRLLSICDRAYQRKNRRREACIASTQTMHTQSQISPSTV